MGKDVLHVQHLQHALDHTQITVLRRPVGKIPCRCDSSLKKLRRQDQEQMNKPCAVEKESCYETNPTYCWWKKSRTCWHGESPIFAMMQTNSDISNYYISQEFFHEQNASCYVVPWMFDQSAIWTKIFWLNTKELPYASIQQHGILGYLRTVLKWTNRSCSW